MKLEGNIFRYNFTSFRSIYIFGAKITSAKLHELFLFIVSKTQTEYEINVTVLVT